MKRRKKRRNYGKRRSHTAYRRGRKSRRRNPRSNYLADNLKKYGLSKKVAETLETELRYHEEPNADPIGYIRRLKISRAKKEALISFANDYRFS